MKPYDVYMLQRFPRFKALFQERKQELWNLFRNKITFLENQMEMFGTLYCLQCIKKGKTAKEIVFLYSHPYDESSNGWCLNCILEAFENKEAYYDPYKNDVYAIENDGCFAYLLIDEERETKYKKEAKEILATIIEADTYESVHALAPIEEETFEKIIACAIYDIVEKEIKVFFDVE